MGNIMNKLSEMNMIREMIGLENVSEISYPLPHPNADSLDSGIHIKKYALSKGVLEHPEINNVLKEINAFESINPYNIDSYYNMAKSIVEALHIYTSEDPNMGPEISFDVNFPINEDVSNLDEFGVKFLIEFTSDQYLKAGNVADDSDESIFSPPKQAGGWIDKILNKLGLGDVGLKDLLYLYVINKFRSHGTGEKTLADVTHGVMDTLGLGMKNKPTMATSGDSGNMASQSQIHEAAVAFLNEKAPPGMEGWIRSVKKKFEKKYGDKWEEVLYATAWDKYNEGKESTNLSEADDATLNAEHTDLNADQTVVDSPKVPTKVKSDVKSRIKELNNLIKQFEEKKHFRGEVKPAIFNARDSLTFIMNKLKGGTMLEFKEAQIHFQKLMSPITNLFPPSLVKFLATGDAEESIVTKDIKG